MTRIAIDTLYDIVQIMGHEVQGIKVRSHFESDAQYIWIFITPK